MNFENVIYTMKWKNSFGNINMLSELATIEQIFLLKITLDIVIIKALITTVSLI